MTARTIEVMLSDVDRKLIPNQNHNPLVVAAGDTVTWKVVSAAGQVPVQVEFVAFVPGHPPPGANQGHSPFSGPVQPGNPNAVDSAAERGLYLYIILDSDGNVLLWQTPLFTAGSFSAFLAGIEKPTGPP